MDEDEKGPFLCTVKWKKLSGEVRDKNATGGVDVPGDVLKFLAEDGLRIMTPLINNVHETGELPQGFH